MIARVLTFGENLYGRPFLLLTLTALFWGGNAIAGQLLVGEVSPMTVTFLRWIIVSSLMWAVAGRGVVREWHRLRPHILAIVFMAMFGFTTFNALFYVASHHTTAVNIGILQGAIPVFVLAGAFLLHQTRVGPLQLVGVAVTIFGVVVVTTKGEPGRLLELSFNIGDLIMLLACAFYAAYAVALRNRPKVPGLVFFALLSLVAVVTSVPLMVFEVLTDTMIWPTPEGWVITAYIALFPSCLAQLFFMRGVELVGPGRAGVFVNLVPVFAALLAVILLAESFRLYHAAALALVLGGIWIAERSKPGGAT